MIHVGSDVIVRLPGAGGVSKGRVRLLTSKEPADVMIDLADERTMWTSIDACTEVSDQLSFPWDFEGALPNRGSSAAITWQVHSGPLSEGLAFLGSEHPSRPSPDWQRQWMIDQANMAEIEESRMQARCEVYAEATLREMLEPLGIKCPTITAEAVRRIRESINMGVGESNL